MQDPEKRIHAINATVRTQERLINREAKLKGLDKSIEQADRAVSAGLAEEFRSMSTEDLRREVDAYRQGHADARKMNGPAAGLGA